MLSVYAAQEFPSRKHHTGFASGTWWDVFCSWSLQPDTKSGRKGHVRCCWRLYFGSRVIVSNAGL